MIIFKSCKCGKPLISLDKGVIFERQNIDIIKNNCSICCPVCGETINFSKEEFTRFYNKNTDTCII